MAVFSGYGVTYPGKTKPVLSGLHLTIHKGTCLLLTGATGSGKSTLALALKGILPGCTTTGRISFGTVAGNPPSVGLVLQNPETQLFATSIGEEVAFALENRSVAPENMEKPVRKALDAVGLSLPLSTPIAPLSMGQKYRVLMAAILVMDPDILILDEPAAQLDTAGLCELRNILQSITETGTAVILCEHRKEAFSSIIDHHWHLACGRLKPGRPDPENPPIPLPPVVSAQPRHVVIEATDLSAGKKKAPSLWKNASFTIQSGERVLVEGPNGSGKSTLLRMISGLEAPRGGTLRIWGRAPSLQQLAKKTGLLFQNPQRQLFEDRVEDEVAFCLKRSGVLREKIQPHVREILHQCGVAHLADHSPHTLSFGQKHLVALASVLVKNPTLLLLDDPFAGLDVASRQRAWEAIGTWQNHGEDPVKTLIWTSHHEAPCFPGADRKLFVEGGKIVSHTVSH